MGHLSVTRLQRVGLEGLLAAGPPFLFLRAGGYKLRVVLRIGRRGAR
jgi:hypothetical protein